MHCSAWGTYLAPGASLAQQVRPSAALPRSMNMWQGFRWLMMDLQPGDSLVFHYSGRERMGSAVCACVLGIRDT